MPSPEPSRRIWLCRLTPGGWADEKSENSKQKLDAGISFEHSCGFWTTGRVGNWSWGRKKTNGRLRQVQKPHIQVTLPVAAIIAMPLFL